MQLLCETRVPEVCRSHILREAFLPKFPAVLNPWRHGVARLLQDAPRWECGDCAGLSSSEVIKQLVLFSLLVRRHDSVLYKWASTTKSFPWIDSWKKAAFDFDCFSSSPFCVQANAWAKRKNLPPARSSISIVFPHRCFAIACRPEVSAKLRTFAKANLEKTCSEADVRPSDF